ncbi:hypothetical protein [Micromonospora zamorensis]|uniref:hypothetical protein n=1 Tax=Micromonospora zamorensis TaxID=709883 RepID=UPI003CF851CB
MADAGRRAFSIIAGLAYLPVALGDDPNLKALIQYTAAGDAFFVIQAATLAWTAHRRAPVVQA